MNWVGESGFGLPSRPVRTQFVSFYCSSGAPVLSEQQCSSHHVQIPTARNPLIPNLVQAQRRLSLAAQVDNRV